MTHRFVFSLALLCLFCLTATAQPRLARSIIAGGAVRMEGTGQRLVGTVAQPVIGLTVSTTVRAGLGFWYRIGNTSTGIPEAPPMALHPYLGTNYPNPFGPASASGADATRLELTLPVAGEVTVTLHDAMGRCRAVLIEGTLSPGRHTIHVGAGDLPAGMYICRLSVGGWSAERKMLLLR
jgi:hypothetical protein